MASQKAKKSGEKEKERVEKAKKKVAEAGRDACKKQDNCRTVINEPPKPSVPIPRQTRLCPNDQPATSSETATNSVKKAQEAGPETSSSEDNMGVDEVAPAAKKSKPGLDDHNEVDKDILDLEANERGKRSVNQVMPPINQPSHLKKKKKSTEVPSRLAIGWENTEITHPPLSRRRDTKNKGLISDNEDDKQKLTKLTVKDQNNKKKKCDHAAHEDLRPDVEDTYLKKVLPIIFDQLGQIYPWTQLSDSAITKIWNQVFDFSHHIDHKSKNTQKKREFNQLRELITHDASNNWTVRIYQRAQEAVEDFLKKQTDGSDTEKMALVQLQLGGNNLEEWKKTEKKESNPFIWGTSAEVGWDGHTLEDLYKTPLILHPFSAHLEMASGLSKNEYCFCKKPWAVIVISLQAVSYL
ncbi:hypothetical protein NP233_g8524 [Leucocoprinus birnbaumii]|uniref:Uncharacterized protein n=1 Tax=Leucocoprinus birnbaumii TaxID=56174 RepID=A0AAD5VM90_9AGAR|nr:hypothetical protein NP233_g8524 [Leucocoprinus birnbaumii]